VPPLGPSRASVWAQAEETRQFVNTVERWERRGRVKTPSTRGNFVESHSNLTIFFIFIGHNKLIKIPKT
jgi:hypothetical protein